jgi:hypothetical protein
MNTNLKGFQGGGSCSALSDGQLQNGQALIDWLGLYGVDLTEPDL